VDREVCLAAVVREVSGRAGREYEVDVTVHRHWVDVDVADPINAVRSSVDKSRPPNSIATTPAGSGATVNNPRSSIGDGRT
jgi:hypothetical protein